MCYTVRVSLYQVKLMPNLQGRCSVTFFSLYNVFVLQSQCNQFITLSPSSVTDVTVRYRCLNSEVSWICTLGVCSTALYEHVWLGGQWVIRTTVLVSSHWQLILTDTGNWIRRMDFRSEATITCKMSQFDQWPERDLSTRLMYVKSCNSCKNEITFCILVNDWSFKSN